MFSILLSQYRAINLIIINYIEKRGDVIPFSEVLIGYMKLPFLIKLLINVISGIVLATIFYNIGFIILQSKGKNEVLSLITAYQNPIPYSSSLVLMYSFIFLLLFIPILIMFLIAVIYRRMLTKYNNQFKEKGFNKRRIFFLNSLLFLGLLLGEVIIGVLLIIFIPIIPFIMLYQSKYSSFLEALIKYIYLQIEINFGQIASTDLMAREIALSFTVPNMLFIILCILIYLINPGRFKSNALIAVSMAVTFLCSFLILALLLMHALFQFGNLGKNFAQFDVDYIQVEYIINNQSRTIDGIKVYHDKNFLIIRDGCNMMHTITSNEMYVTSSFGEFTCSEKDQNLMNRK